MNAPARRAAIHEAGHAVAAHVLGLPVTAIEIGDDGGGTVWHEVHRGTVPLEDAGAIELIQMDIVASMAGAIAEEVVAGNPNTFSGARLDRQATAEALAVLPDPERTRTRLEARTRALVRRHHGAILLVASALQDAGGRLAGEEVRRVLNDHVATEERGDTMDYITNRRRIFEDAMRDRPDATEAETAAAWQAASEAAAAGESGPPLDRRTEPVGSEIHGGRSDWSTRVVSGTDWYMAKAIARGMLR